MKNSITIALLLSLVAGTLAAQVRPAGSQARNWVSIYAQMYTGMGRFDDPGSDSRWAFSDNAFGIGASFLREFGQSLQIGIDVSAARPDYERKSTDGADVLLGSGTATVATALAVGRMAYGGAADLGFYLTGGIGTIAYMLDDLDAWNTDLALRAGTGLEYRFQPGTAMFLEWGRIWGYHEKEGLSGGRVNHSVLKLGAKFGL